MKIKRYRFLLIIISVVSALSCREQGVSREPSISAEALFGPISREQYLSGRFHASKSSLFVNPADLGIPVDGKSHFLRKETAAALKRMHDAFRKDHPGVKLIIVSSTRNFWDQKAIWEKKWESKEYVSAAPDPYRRASLILRYSSMPGTSRHHWGTDFDLNTLTNDYYERGDGRIIYQWLRENAAKFGFCQPYTAGRERGYQEERWHWSYVPLSRHFLKQWNALFAGPDSPFAKKGLFAGSEKSGHLAPVYVNSIHDGCR